MDVKDHKKCRDMIEQDPHKPVCFRENPVFFINLTFIPASALSYRKGLPAGLKDIPVIWYRTGNSFQKFPITREYRADSSCGGEVISPTIIRSSGYARFSQTATWRGRESAARRL
jgi:hypothetical protein